MKSAITIESSSSTLTTALGVAIAGAKTKIVNDSQEKISVERRG
jgi:hypothetical protein